MQNLNFVLSGRSDSGLTQIWHVESVHTGVHLGSIKWYVPWRRYAFYPDAGSLYDATCLTEISKFLNEQMELRKR